MTRIRFERGLAFVSAAITFRGQTLTLQRVFLDTGSAGSDVSADRVGAIGRTHEMDDEVHRLRGVGGSELVFCKCVEEVRLGELVARDFDVEVGVWTMGLTSTESWDSPS